jgi:hypothetical protein
MGRKGWKSKHLFHYEQISRRLWQVLKSLIPLACLISLQTLATLEYGCANISKFTPFATNGKLEQTSLNASANFKEYCQMVELEALQLFNDCADQKNYQTRGEALMQKLCVIIINCIQNGSLTGDPLLQRKFVAVLAYSKTCGKIDISGFEYAMYDSLAALFAKSEGISKNWSSGSGFNLSLNNANSDRTKKIYKIADILGRCFQHHN